MTVSKKRVGLTLLAALSIWAPSGRLAGQEPRSPIDALLSYVEKDVRVVVPPEMRPYEIGRLFLRVDARIPERILGSVGQGVLERHPVEMVHDTIRAIDMLVKGPGASAHVRDDGVYVSIGAVDRVSQGALAITFAYFVTTRRPGSGPVVCLEERRLVLIPPRAGNADWEVVEAKRLGGC
jgi:hypothetical protein